MKKLLTFIAVLGLTACSDVPTPMPDGHGGGMRARLVGGKGALYYNADGSMSYVFNQVQSFQHFMQFLSLAASQGFTALQHLADQTTTQMLNGEITRREGAARLAEVEKAKIALQGQAVEKVAPGTATLAPITVKPVGP